MFIGCSLGLSIVRIRVLLNLHTSLFEMPAHAEAMARAALAQGRPDATDRLVALVEALAGKE